MLPHDRRDQWLDTAVSGIRFGLDRKAVRKELEDHMEDKLAGLRRLFPDIPEEEAQDRVLRDMGDAQELKASLARVHRPWLGYLWRVSQWVLAAAVLLLLFSSGRWGSGWFAASGRRDWEGTTLLTPAGERVELGGYTVSMTRASIRGEGNEANILWAELRITAPWFWALDGRSLCSHTSATDSLGNIYYSDDRWSRLDPAAYPTPARWVRGTLLDRTPFHRDCWLSVWGVDPEAEWLRLEYEWLGSGFSMTIDLKEAEG